jgi:transcriptional regulator NrdR family protein
MSPYLYTTIMRSYYTNPKVVAKRLAATTPISKPKDMSRITKFQKETMLRHIEASKQDKFDLEKTDSIIDVQRALSDGKTIRSIHENIEARYCSVGSAVMSRLMQHESKSYIRDLSKGYKEFMNAFNIK